MASEYLKWKYRDVKPEEKRELTPAEKRKNWWEYHWWQLLLAIVGAAAAVSLVLTMLGVGQVKPDYQMAYVGSAALSEELAAEMEQAAAALGEDCDGDGAVTVRLNRYQHYAPDSADSNAMLYAQATEAKLVGDLEGCDSYFFLLEDPAWFQERYGVLVLPDGGEPAEDADGTACAVRVCDCPALAALLGEDGGADGPLGSLWLARRGFWTDKTSANPEQCQALWAVLTVGAAR